MNYIEMKIFVRLLLLALPSALVAQNNTFKPGQLWLDNNGVFINAHGGGLLFYNGTYYWFGEHKTPGKRGNRAWVGVHCYSSADLYNWKDEGIALKTVNDTLSDIRNGCILERPKVIFNRKTGKFVMWFHLEKAGTGYSTAASGIAVSDRVTGPYQYLHSVRPNAGQWPVNMPRSERKLVQSALGKPVAQQKEDSLTFFTRDFGKGQMARDMTLFVDDDGKAYHIFASEENRTMHISQLTDDYLGYSGKYTRIFEERSMEAPALFKMNKQYYFMGSGCTGWAPNAARSAVADKILGTWKELGNPCLGRDSAKTYHSQSTYILPVQGKKNSYIFMADRWNPDDAIDGRYIWLPVRFVNGKPQLQWLDEWDLGWFDRNAPVTDN